MPLRKKRWILLLLLIPILFLLRQWIPQRPEETHSEETPAADRQPIQPQDPSHRHSDSKQAPVFVPFDQERAVTPPQEAEYILSGRVTTVEEEALPGATVSLYASRPQRPRFEWPAPISSAACDNDGRYEIRLIIPIADAVVAIRKEGYATLEDFQRLAFPGRVVKNYVLREAPCCVEGRVSSEEGQPVAGARITSSMNQVWVAGPLDLSHLSVFAMTDNTGRFRLMGLPEERIQLRASAPGHLFKDAGAVLKRGPCSSVDFSLQTAHAISFVVKDRRGGVLSSSTAQSPAGSAAADENGRIDLILPPGNEEVDCTVSAKGYKPNTFRLNPKMPPGEIILQDGDLCSGRVLSQSGIPIAGAKVAVIGSGPGTLKQGPGKLPLPPLGTSEGDAVTDLSGRFSIPVSNPPVTRITVTKRRYIEQRMSIDGNVPSGREIEIRLQPAGCGFFGRVVDAAGNPVPRFEIVLYEASAILANHGYRRTFDNAGGMFSITDVPAGIYDVAVKNLQSPPATLRLQGIEVRSGYWYGEILIQFR